MRNCTPLPMGDLMALTNSGLLTLYETALQNVLSGGQAMSNQGRSYTLADVKFLEEQCAKYRIKVARDSGGSNIKQITPVDT